MTRPLSLPSAFDFAQLDCLAGFAYRVLMLDYDGTLAPFRSRRMDAVPYAGVGAALSTLVAAGHTRTVIVSGRPIAELRALLDTDLTVEMWGAHGWERQTAEGRFEQWRPSPPIVALLHDAAETARAHVPVEAVEVKAASVAVHTRALTAPERARVTQMVEEHWVHRADGDTIHLRVFDGGYELRAVTRTKGSVVDVLRRDVSTMGAGNALFAYLGDDDTDEDAFAALTPDDWPILVRAEPRPTRARFWLAPPADLLQFIHAWTFKAR